MSAWDRKNAAEVSLGGDPDELCIETIGGKRGVKRAMLRWGTTVVTLDDNPQKGDAYDIGAGRKPLPTTLPKELVDDVVAKKPPPQEPKNPQGSKGIFRLWG